MNRNTARQSGTPGLLLNSRPLRLWIGSGFQPIESAADAS
jgi:hypothetical protein